ncbi:MAG TPA: hypothetical protein VJ833_04400 [Rhodanobacteraceae bacterium]|nr:hypothetical protein [Rhodanobacteraceae bacterium]
MILRHRFHAANVPALARIGVALLLVAVAGTCMAAPRIELQLGRSYSSSRSAATAFAEGTFSEQGIGSTRFTWAPDVSAGWIDGRDPRRHRHARYSVTDSIWLVAAGAQFRYGSPGDWYHHLFFSFQPALHAGRTQRSAVPTSSSARSAGRPDASASRFATFPTVRCMSPTAAKPCCWWVCGSARDHG